MIWGTCTSIIHLNIDNIHTYTSINIHTSIISFIPFYHDHSFTFITSQPYPSSILPSADHSDFGTWQLCSTSKHVKKHSSQGSFDTQIFRYFFFFFFDTFFLLHLHFYIHKYCTRSKYSNYFHITTHWEIFLCSYISLSNHVCLYHVYDEAFLNILTNPCVNTVLKEQCQQRENIVALAINLHQLQLRNGNRVQSSSYPSQNRVQWVQFSRDQDERCETLDSALLTTSRYIPAVTCSPDSFFGFCIINIFIKFDTAETLFLY